MGVTAEVLGKYSAAIVRNRTMVRRMIFFIFLLISSKAFFFVGQPGSSRRARRVIHWLKPSDLCGFWQVFGNIVMRLGCFSTHCVCSKDKK